MQEGEQPLSSHCGCPLHSTLACACSPLHLKEDEKERKDALFQPFSVHFHGYEMKVELHRQGVLNEIEKPIIWTILFL